MFIVCHILSNNNCIESNTKQFKHKVKHEWYKSFQETYVYGDCRWSEGLEDKNTIQQNFILDQLFTLLENKIARIRNHSFENRQTNQIKHCA